MDDTRMIIEGISIELSIIPKETIAPHDRQWRFQFTPALWEQPRILDNSIEIPSIVSASISLKNQRSRNY
jgi:hypothetical protein